MIHVIQECDEINITSNTTWTSANVPNGGRFDEVVVEDGSILTIEEDVTVSFCPGGSLTIENNAELRLYGTLTSACDESWTGVIVYGDSEHNQYYDIGAGGYHHGLFRGYPGSVIENAATSVQLFGPDPEDTGGKIRCEGTTFRNHQMGVSFGPYGNIVGSIPHHYQASFKDCIFEVNTDFFHAGPFVVHANLVGVLGVGFHGCDFINGMNFTGASSVSDFGYGIRALGAGFSVSAVSPDYPDECETPCDRSTFIGLGYGVAVSTGADLKNKEFRINHSDFTRCFTGISVDGVSAGTMIYNRFYMGSISDETILNGDQIGINLLDGINGFNLQDNYFEASSENTENTLGIVAGNLGINNNVIRRNVFNGLIISNEAFGLNGSLNQVSIGLTYLCNENGEIRNKDFYIVDNLTSGYDDNSIRSIQAAYDDLHEIATGNSFSRAGDEEDGDFANHGEYEIEYWYDDNEQDQIPVATEGLSNSIVGDPNGCSTENCIEPCPIVVADERGIYLGALPVYGEKLEASEWDSASIYKTILDRSAQRAVQYYLEDTLTYSDDSLVLWYFRLLSPVGHILASRHYASSGDFTSSAEILADIPQLFDLSAQEEGELVDIQDTYDILDARSLDELTQNDIEDLEEISTHGGHGAAMARGILRLLGYHFDPEYYLPQEQEEFFRPQLPTYEIPKPDFQVYPNPSDGQFLKVYVPLHVPNAVFELFDGMGRTLYVRKLNPGTNTLKDPPVAHLSGICIYRISDGNEIQSGILLMMPDVK